MEIIENSELGSQKQITDKQLGNIILRTCEQHADNLLIACQKAASNSYQLLQLIFYWYWCGCDMNQFLEITKLSLIVSQPIKVVVVVIVVILLCLWLM